MAIGLFDSGLGGLTIHRAVTDRLPSADVIYLADQAHMPYGTLPGEKIVELTRAGCERLFSEGCDLIVLACNTASAVALSRLQQTWLPAYRRTLGRAANVLGIIVPTIEAITGRPWQGPHSMTLSSSPQEVVGIFATAATGRTRVYEIEIAKRRPDLRVVTEVCPGLARLIEHRADTAKLTSIVHQHVQAMRERAGRWPAKVILGSTHYELAADLFRRCLPGDVELLHQPFATADALQAYLRRHPEYRTAGRGLHRFLTTGTSGEQVARDREKPVFFQTA